MSTNLHLRNCKRLISQHSLTPFSMLAILIVHMSTGVIEPAVPMESALLLGQALTALSLSTTQSTGPPFILAAGTLAPTLIWHFVSVGPDSCVLDRRISEKFPRSQHHPSLTVPPRLALPVPSKPVKRWNFRKANWSHYNTLTNKLAKSLLPPDLREVDLAYHDFCNVIRTAAKNSIPRCRRSNHIPCWDAKCENLYRTFLQSPEGSDSNRAATALLIRLDKKRTNRWSEAVQTIDFSHSSQKKSMEYIEQPNWQITALPSSLCRPS